MRTRPGVVGLVGVAPGVREAGHLVPAERLQGDRQVVEVLAVIPGVVGVLPM